MDDATFARLFALGQTQSAAAELLAEIRSHFADGRRKCPECLAEAANKLDDALRAARTATRAA